MEKGNDLCFSMCIAFAGEKWYFIEEKPGTEAGQKNVFPYRGRVPPAGAGLLHWLASFLLAILVF